MNNYRYFQGNIKIIKYIFLSAGICTLAGTIIYMILRNSDYTSQNNEISQIKQTFEKNYTVSINNTVLEGTSSDLKPYKIIAKTINKDKKNQYIIQSLYGQCFDQNENIIIKSSTGVFDEITSQIELNNEIVIIFRGIEIKADQIYFNLNTRDVKTNYPVVVNLHNAQINANAIETRDLNEIIELKNGVKASFVIKDSK